MFSLEITPPGVCLSINRMALWHSDFVSSAVYDFLNWD